MYAKKNGPKKYYTKEFFICCLPVLSYFTFEVSVQYTYFELGSSLFEGAICTLLKF
jgi:hypothetical protein